MSDWTPQECFSRALAVSGLLEARICPGGKVVPCLKTRAWGAARLPLKEVTLPCGEALHHQLLLIKN